MALGDSFKSNGLNGYYEAAAEAGKAPNAANAFDSAHDSNAYQFILSQEAMKAEDGGSSIAVVNDRAAGLSGGAECEKDKERRKQGQATNLYILMAQSLQDSLQDYIKDLGGRIDKANEMLNAFDNGEFDPRNNEEHAKFLAQMGKTPEQWAEASEEEQRQMFVDHIEGLEARVKTAQDLYPRLDAVLDELERDPNAPLDPDIFSVTNGAFDNALLEEAAKFIEADQDGVEFDRFNLTFADVQLLCEQVKLMVVNSRVASYDVEEHAVKQGMVPLDETSEMNEGYAAMASMLVPTPT